MNEKPHTIRKARTIDATGKTSPTSNYLDVCPRDRERVKKQNRLRRLRVEVEQLERELQEQI